jgi:hypothetical protein
MLNGLWEVNYSCQRLKGVYDGEDQRDDHVAFPRGVSLFEYFKNGDKDNLIDTLFQFSKNRLDPPGNLGFSSLRKFLLNAVIPNTGQGVAYGIHAPSTIILDERRDPTDTTATTRQWDSDAYLRYPPSGTNIYTETLDLRRLFQRLSEEVLPTLSNSPVSKAQL